MYHHTQEEKQKAIELYIRSGFSPTTVQRTLGYPSRSTLSHWYHDYLKRGYVRAPKHWTGKFTEEQKRIAIDHYLATGRNASKTVRDLGYPSRTLLSQWIDELAPGMRKTTKPHKKFTDEERIEVLLKSAKTPTVKQVIKDFNIDKVTFYNWRKKFLGKEAQGVIDDINQSALLNEIDSLKENISKLEAEVKYHKMEVAIWKEAAELVKKDLGIDPRSLSNKEKAALVDALKTTFTLNELLEYLGLARSSYYYQLAAMTAPDKYADLRKLIRNEFEAESKARGHRTIWARLRKREEPVIVSEKVVLRIMKEEGLNVSYSNKKKRRWSSYAGEIGDHPENLINRDFHADAPNVLWLTDITQFTLPDFKCYLSPVIDCFDGKVVSRKIALHPNAELANSMLDDAIASLSEGEHPICHNDCGCHYRWPGWIQRCEKAGIIRSMSKKGCSPDNSACEGFFGRLKNEFFYGKNWKGVTFEEFSHLLDDYIEFYNEGRIKKSLGWMSPNEYRRSLGLAA